MKRTEFSEFGIGTWNLGGRGEPDYSHDAQNLESLRYAISRGVNFFDTAEMYASGHSEELLGKALQGEDRNRFFITTKAWPSSFGNLENAIKNSLKRLNMDHVDLYLLHWPDEKYDHRKLINDLLRLKDEGYTENIGVSNYDINLLKEAWELSGGQIFANQIEVNVEKVSAFNQIKEFCLENNIMVVAYTPLNKNRMPQNSRMQNNIRKSGLNPAQYSLIYTISIGAYPIPKAASIEHLDMLFSAVEMYRKGIVKIISEN